MQDFKLNDAMSNFMNLKDAAILYKKTMDLWGQYTSVLKVNYIPIKYENSAVLKMSVNFHIDRYSAGRYSSYDKYRGRYNNLKETFNQKRKTKAEIQAIADDSGLPYQDAATIQAGGFVETVIE